MPICWESLSLLFLSLPHSQILSLWALIWSWEIKKYHRVPRRLSRYGGCSNTVMRTLGYRNLTCSGVRNFGTIFKQTLSMLNDLCKNLTNTFFVNYYIISETAKIFRRRSSLIKSPISSMFSSVLTWKVVQSVDCLQLFQVPHLLNHSKTCVRDIHSFPYTSLR